MHSLSDSLGALAALLPATLLPDAARRLVMEKAARIPSALADAWGFECRLDADPQVDLLYCAVREQAQALIDAEPALRGFPAAWTVLARDVWVEHDVVDPPLPPSVFFHLARSDDALRLFPGEGAVERVLAALPEGALLDQVGRMLSRSDAPLRFVVMLPRGRVESFLDAVSWTGDRTVLRSRLAWLEGACDYTTVDLEIGHPGLGLEAHFHRRAQPVTEPRWRRLLDDLCAEGRCLPGKRDDLLRLPLAAPDPSIWGTDCLLILSHLKISIPAESAKAYLGFLRVRR